MLKFLHPHPHILKVVSSPMEIPQNKPLFVKFSNSRPIIVSNKRTNERTIEQISNEHLNERTNERSNFFLFVHSSGLIDSSCIPAKLQSFDYLHALQFFISTIKLCTKTKSFHIVLSYYNKM